MYKIGLSVHPKNASEELLYNMANVGIGAVELSCGIVDGDAGVDYKAIAESAKKSGVELWSFHLPFAPFYEVDISSTDKTLCRKSITLCTEKIKQMSQIGITRFIIHPSSEPIEENEREAKLEISSESLAELAETAKKVCGGTVCVEDLPRTCLGRDSDDIQKLISAHDDLRVCFDTNHLLKENNVDFIRKLGKKIVTTHVSDYDLVDEKHWLPGEGKNDWNAIMDVLEEIGYDGVWLYELGFAKPTKIITRDRKLTCEDFARNAHEIFARKPITNISHPII